MNTFRPQHSSTDCHRYLFSFLHKFVEMLTCRWSTHWVRSSSLFDCHLYSICEALHRAYSQLKERRVQPSVFGTYHKLQYQKEEYGTQTWLYYHFQGTGAQHPTLILLSLSSSERLKIWVAGTKRLQIQRWIVSLGLSLTACLWPSRRTITVSGEEEARKV